MKTITGYFFFLGILLCLYSCSEKNTSDYVSLDINGVQVYVDEQWSGNSKPVCLRVIVTSKELFSNNYEFLEIALIEKNIPKRNEVS